jgi:hypothetical protein
MLLIACGIIWIIGFSQRRRFAHNGLIGGSSPPRRDYQSLSLSLSGSIRQRFWPTFWQAA